MAAMFGARIGHLDTLIRRGEKEFKGGNFSSGVALFKEAHQLVLELEGKLGLDENLGQFRKDLMQRKVEILGQISRGMSTQELGRTQPQVAPASGPDGMDTRRLELPVDKDLLIKDICGLEDIKSALVDVLVTPFFYPGVIPAEHQFHGIMLYGPSGGGKTKIVKAMVNSLKATLDFKVVFLNITMDKVLGKFHGDTERNLTEVFEKAQSYKDPVVLFFDEFDGIAGTRGCQGRNEVGETKIVNHFLHLLDGIRDNANIIVIATTNRPYSVDCSFYRRFRLLYVPLPNKEERAKLLRHLVGRIQKLDGPDSAKIDFENLAALTYGYSPADLSALVSVAIQGLRLAPVTKAIREKLEENKKFTVPVADTFESVKKNLTYETLLTAKRQTTPTNVESYLNKLESFLHRHGGNAYLPLPLDEPDFHCLFCLECCQRPGWAATECIMMCFRFFFDGCC